MDFAVPSPLVTAPLLRQAAAEAATGTASGRVRGQTTVLAVCDFSPAAANAAWRAALVARDVGAAVRILHPQPQARVLQKGGHCASTLAQEIAQRLQLPVEAEAVAGNVLGAAIAAARDAALLVIPSRRGNPLREWIMGTQAERLIRLSRAPVLVAKRPALGSYRKVLVPVELAAAAAVQVRLALALSRGSRVEVLHALQTADEIVLHELEAANQVLHSCRQYRSQRAHAALHELMALPGEQSEGVQTVVEFGAAANMVLARAQAGGSDLVVIGKRRRGLLADYFLGGVTQRVLALSQADVLVLPARAQGAGALSSAGWSAPLRAEWNQNA
jgi:nucleotide-binding universal stress UspA family protein